MNNILRTKMEEIVNIHLTQMDKAMSPIEQANQPFTIAMDAFHAGFEACHDLMIEDMKKLVEALGFAIEQRDYLINYANLNPNANNLEVKNKFSDQALQEYKSKWGEDV